MPKRYRSGPKPALQPKTQCTTLGIKLQLALVLDQDHLGQGNVLGWLELSCSSSSNSTPLSPPSGAVWRLVLVARCKDTQGVGTLWDTKRWNECASFSHCSTLSCNLFLSLGQFGACGNFGKAGANAQRKGWAKYQRRSNRQSVDNDNKIDGQPDISTKYFPQQQGLDVYSRIMCKQVFHRHAGTQCWWIRKEWLVFVIWIKMVHRVMRSKYQKSVTYRNTSRLRLATHLAPFSGRENKWCVVSQCRNHLLGKRGEVEVK